MSGNTITWWEALDMMPKPWLTYEVKQRMGALFDEHPKLEPPVFHGNGIIKVSTPNGPTLYMNSAAYEALLEEMRKYPITQDMLPTLGSVKVVKTPMLDHIDFSKLNDSNASTDPRP